MAVAFTQGTLLGPDDLSVSLVDELGAFIDPYSISYSFYGEASNNGALRDYLIGSQYNDPVRSSEGVYYVGERIGSGFLVGSYYVQWMIKRQETSPLEIIGKTYFAVYREG